NRCRSPPPTRRKNEFRARGAAPHQAGKRRRLHEAGPGKRAERAQGARLQAVRRAGRSARSRAGHAVRGLHRRAGLRGAPADSAFQEVPRRGGAAARLALAPCLAPRRLMDLKLAELPPLERYKLLLALTRCTKIGFISWPLAEGAWRRFRAGGRHRPVGEKRDGAEPSGEVVEVRVRAEKNDRNIARPAVGLQRGEELDAVHESHI